MRHLKLTSICKVCHAPDTYTSNGDCDGCNECGSIEQGFWFVDDFDNGNFGLLVTEDGDLLNENTLEVVGSELFEGYFSA